MARCPFAVWRPLPENSTQVKITPTQVVLHSAVDADGPTSLYGYFSRGDVVVESHFFVKMDGVIEQYLDTTVRGDAQLDGNTRAISIETEDDGEPNQREWNAKQLAAIVRLIRWIRQEHPAIPAVKCPAWDKPGIGYHSMWGTGPTHWIPYTSRGKTCPGTVRIDQVPGIVRAVAQEDDVSAAEVWAHPLAIGEATASAGSWLKYANRKAEQARDEAKAALAEAKAAHADAQAALAEAKAIRSAVAALTTKVDGLKVGGVDVQALAEAVGNELHARMQA